MYYVCMCAKQIFLTQYWIIFASGISNEVDEYNEMRFFWEIFSHPCNPWFFIMS